MARRGIKNTKWDGILNENLDPTSSSNDFDKRFEALFKIYNIKDEEPLIAFRKLVFFLANELKIQGFMYHLEHEDIVKEYRAYIFWKVVNVLKKESGSVEKTIDKISLVLDCRTSDEIQSFFLKYFPKYHLDTIISILKQEFKRGDICRYYQRIKTNKNYKLIHDEINGISVSSFFEICSMYPTYCKLLNKEKKIKEDFINRFC